INVSFFQDKLPRSVGDVLKVIILLMQADFLGILIWYGFLYANIGMMSKSPAMGISMIIPYIAVPVGGIFSIFQVIVLIITGKSSSDFQEG
ncbi:MAG: TRAP transporter small permease, partial [Desulfobacterales bacterium]|nr:TRAP transporter small permease [Desulfobacterales bacterium]